jgi:hypothetical protein
MASFLTGVHPRKTAGADVKAGVSVDQFAALKIGGQTKFPSLEIGCERGPQAGACDTGYSCTYSANLSWRSATLPMAKEVDPRLVFERLFAGPVKGEAEEARGRRARYQKSILDFVREDATRLRARVGAADQRKLDEYLQAVREVEGRVERAGRGPDAPPPGTAKPAGIRARWRGASSGPAAARTPRRRGRPSRPASQRSTPSTSGSCPTCWCWRSRAT